LKKLLIFKRRARFEYEILEEYEAGIVLYGTEIKSLRSSKASITESFVSLLMVNLYH
jgi:SsrA-binding protein